MTSLGQIWKCEVCGNIVEVLHTGSDSLVCCGKDMVLKDIGSDEGYMDKHAPIIEGKKISVGNVLHPMEEEHYIEWIEGVSKDGEIVKKFLKSGEKPVVEFCFEPVSARMYCNIHGLWASS